MSSGRPKRGNARNAQAIVAESRDPLYQFMHREHRPNGKRLKLMMWAALVTAAFLCGILFTFLPLSFLPMLLTPIALLTMFVIWALPRTKSAPTKLLTNMYFAFFVALIVWPNYLAISISGLPWITVIRLIGLPMAAVFLVSISTFPGMRQDLNETLNHTPWIWKLFVAFVVVQFLTIPFSSAIFTSFSRFVIAQVNWTMIFFLSCYIFRVESRAQMWASLMLIMALLVVVIGGLEWRQSRVLWAGHIPSFLAVSDEAVQRILAGTTRLGMFYRTQSTFTTSLSFAEYLALTTPFAIHFAVEGTSRSARLAATMCVPVIFFGVITTDSRLGALGFFLSLLLYAAVWALRRWRTNPTSIFGPAIVLGYPLLFGGFVLATLFNLRLYRMVWGGGQYQFSTDARQEQIAMAIPKILHAPWGHGIGQAADALQFYSPAGLLTIDSYYLTVALEYGVLGFIVYYGMFAAGIIYGSRAIFRTKSYGTSFIVPAVIALANFIVVKSVLSQEAGHPLAFMLLGMVVALAYRVNLENTPVATEQPT